MMQRKSRTRSFTGCDQCKRRHVKCDEAKPSCTRCISAGGQCSYSYKLSWGGRGFDKSCFGVCLKGNKVSKIRKYLSLTALTASPFPHACMNDIVAEGNKRTRRVKSPNNTGLGTETGSFIYTSTRNGRNSYPADCPIPGKLDSEYGGTLSKGPTVHRYLLQFFVYETSRIISCHQGVWNNLCRAVIPMALEHPCLMSAVLALAGNYFLSSGASSLHIDTNLIAQLSNSSITGLRSAFNMRTPVTEAELATAMLLCLCDIHSGMDASGSWRVHFQGAGAIMSSLGHSSAALYSENQSNTRRLLSQMYTSIELIASLTVKGLSKRQYSRISLQGNCIDEYFGISTSLLDTLYEVGAAAAKRRRMDRDADCSGILSYGDLLQEADSLEHTVHCMMERDQTIPTPFHVRIEDILSPEEKQEYVLCNEAYQHTALINIDRRIRALPGSTPEIQASVQRILDIAGQMKPTSGLSPWLLMATPLFTAGSEAVGSDRDRTRSLFVALHSTIRITNYESSLELLETYWKASDEGLVQDIESILGM